MGISASPEVASWRAPHSTAQQGFNCFGDAKTLNFIVFGATSQKSKFRQAVLRMSEEHKHTREHTFQIFEGIWKWVNGEF